MFFQYEDGKGRKLLNDEFNLTMVADLSHWINVAETDTNDPDLTAVIEAFCSRFRHIHLRVGYDHGPQVNIYILLRKLDAILFNLIFACTKHV